MFVVEILLSLLLSVTSLQSSGNKAAASEKVGSNKETTITTNKAGTSPSTGIGSGGWDPND